MHALCLLLLTLTTGQLDSPKTEPLKAGKHSRTVSSGGAERAYLVYVPKKVDPGKPTPVVLVLHGATMTAAIMERFTGLNDTADAAGFVVVYPNGTGPAELLLTWNSGGFAPAVAKGKADDVAYIGKVLDDLQTVVNVDRKRVFACGLSNGGMMCYRLAAEMSERIAAIASVAGTLAVEKCEPKRPVPVLHFHGTADKLVPFRGPNKNVAPFLKFSSVEDTIDAWVKLNGCDKRPKVSALPKPEDDHEVTRKVFGSGKQDSEVILYVVKDGGHTWPGRPIGGDPLLGAYTLNINANDLIWEFFQRHPMAPLPAQPSATKKLQKLYITNSAGNDVTIVDLATNKTIKTLEVGPRPHGIAAPEAYDFVLVTIEGGKTGELVWIDPVKDVVTRRLSIGPAPNQLAVTPDGKFAYVPVNNGTWEVIDLKEAKIVERIKTGGRPHNTLCSADGKFMYLAPMGNTREVTIVEVAGHKVVGTIRFGESVRPVALSRDGTKFFANVDKLIGFEMADIAARKVLARVEAELTPEQKNKTSRSHGLCLRPGDQEIWNCDVEHFEVQIFDLTGPSPKQRGKIDMGGQVYWLTFSPDGKHAYVSVRSKGQIAVVDTTSRQITAHIQAGQEPKRLIVVEIAAAGKK